MQNAQPLLTVAVPTYNGSKTIRNMLDILLPQVDERVEVLVSDNCSTDETPQIIAEYREKYPFIRYVRNEKNLGADGNFLQCAMLASGKFVMLISDDDIIIENALLNILTFLESNPDICLAYMDTVAFTDHYIGLEHTHGYKPYLPPLPQDILTTNKKEFLHYCLRLWGFTSCYIWKSSLIRQIENPKQYFNTYFLQAYLSILCVTNPKAVLGCIKGPCIAIGEYGVLGNYDVAIVEGINYHRMINFAVEKAGFDRKQLEKYYIWKICYLGRIVVIKQRAVNAKTTKVSNLIRCTWKYPYAWIALYPFLMIPAPVCRFILKTVRKIQGRDFTSYVNRPTELNKKN